MKTAFNILLIFSIITIINCGKSDTSKIDDKKSAGETETKIKTRYVSAKGGLRMRDKPDTSGNKMGTIPTGTKVDLLEETGKDMTISGATGKWSKVKWGDKTGWVFGGFLKAKFSHENFEEFIKNLPSLSNIPVLYKELTKNSWWDQAPDEKGGRTNMGIKFENNVLNISTFVDSYYKILKIESEANRIIIKIEFLDFTALEFSVPSDLKNLKSKGIDKITVILNKDKSISVNGLPFYVNPN